MSAQKKQRCETPEQKAARREQRLAALEKARANLPKSKKTGKASGRARFKEKLNALLRWVYEFGFISAPTACRLLSVKNCDDFLASAVAQGYIKPDVPRHSANPEVPDVVYLLDEAGVHQAERGLVNEDDLLPYDSNSIRRNQYRHDNFVQQIALHLLNKIGGEAMRLEDVFLALVDKEILLSDRRMAVQGSPCRMGSGKKPDLVIRDYKTAGSGDRESKVDLWIELELNAKKGKNMDHDFISRYCMALRDYYETEYNDDFDEAQDESDENPVEIDVWKRWSPDLWLVTDSKALQKRYKTCLSAGYSYPLYWYDKSKKGWVLDRGQGHLPKDEWKQQYGTVSKSVAENINFVDLFDLVPETPLSKLR